jgi:hypothetical protein
MKFRNGATTLLVVTGVLAPAGGAQAATAPDASQFAVAAGALAFDVAPDVPAMPALTLTGSPQTLNTTMSSWSVNDPTGTGAGWNVTVQGDGTPGKSAVFKEYCTDGAAPNGCDTAVSAAPGPGYVTTAPQTFAANSLTLTSTSAGFAGLAGSTGTAPTHSCGSACNVDSATPVKVASAAINAGMGTWQGNTYSPTSLGLAAPTTVKAIGTGNKVYRTDLTWTLSSAP